MRRRESRRKSPPAEDAWRAGRDVRPSGRLVDRVDRLTKAEARAEPELGGGAPAVDHADVADEVELRDGEARDPEPERQLQDRLCHRVWDLHGLAPELLEHRRQRDLPGADDVV